MSEEPTVLDYIKALLTPWRGAPPAIPPDPAQNTASEGPALAGEAPKPSIPQPAVGSQTPVQPEPGAAPKTSQPVRWPLLSILAVLLALAAQISFEPGPDRHAMPGAALYGLSAVLAVWAYFRDEWTLAPVPNERNRPDPLSVSSIPLIAGMLLAALAFLLFTDNTFTSLNVSIWLMALLLLVWAFWLPKSGRVVKGDEEALAPASKESQLKTAFGLFAIFAEAPFIVGLDLLALLILAFSNDLFFGLRIVLWLGLLVVLISLAWQSFERRAAWQSRLQSWLVGEGRLKISPAWALFFLAALVILFYRYYRINAVPPEMVSDQAEKLLDVWDVLHGKYSIFFPRNTGREAFQMYLTAFIAQAFGTGISYLSLKIGTITAGVVTLPYIYLTGKEIGNRRIGFLAMLFAGIAYWPNTISRIGLRFPLYPLFAAPTLYYLLRGLRRSNRNDFILSGIFLGIGLHGYSPFRIMPVVVLALVAIYLLHRAALGKRLKTIYFLMLLVMISVIVFLPLGRYALDNPDMFGYRALTRLGTEERPLPGSPLAIFFQNLWRAMTMFAWDDGSIWVISIPGRPVLDVVGGALFHLGFVLVLARYLRKRNWVDLWLLLAVPLLMLPSILSLAFPDENPAINRASAAIVPVFLLIAIALDGLITGIRQKMDGRGGLALAYGLAGLLFLWSAAQNYDLEFNTFYRQYAQSAWNTSEMGSVIRDFAATMGNGENAYTVAFPYWVDTRLVGMQAGYPTRDTAITMDQLDSLENTHEALLFLVKNDDTDSLQTLNIRYPHGWLQEYHSKYEGKNFWMYFVPPR